MRKPVFIIAKEFVKGLHIKGGIYSDFGIRPFSLTGVISGLGQAKANYTEIGTYANLDKDTARVCIERIIREMTEKVKNVIFHISSQKYLLKSKRELASKWKFQT